VKFSRQGSSFKALCPFHEEKTPSFIVQRGDSHYHCFGCGAHGDAIAFLMNFQKMSFVLAVEYLADRFQVYLKQEEKNEKYQLSKSYYKKQLPISYSKGQRGYVVSDKRTERQLSVSSQFLSNDEMAWLAELNESTDVFLIESNQYIPVHEASTDGYLESASLRKLTFNCILPTNK